MILDGHTIRVPTPGPTPLQVRSGPKGDTGAPGGSDTAQAGWINDPASATSAALKATYVRQRGSLARYGSTPLASKLDVNSLRAPSGTKLAITTYVGGNNEVVEPSVWYDPSGLFGYEFWMAAGPYENSNNAVENPSVWCSHDGITWQVPPGGSNPIVPAPTSGNYDDPHLFEYGGTLYLCWNYTRGSSSDQVLLRSTTDGVTWSATTVLRTGVGGGGAHEYLSPHIEYFAGLWYMWTVDITGTRKITLSTATAITGPWSAPVDCTAPLPSGKDHWEFEVRRVGSEWVMLQNVVTTGGTAGGGELRLRTSADGVTWNLSSAPVLVADPSGGGTRFDSSFIYKASFVPLLDGRLAIWYSAGTGVPRWAIGYTVAERPGANPGSFAGSWYAPPCPVSTAAMANGTVYYVPVYFDRPRTIKGLGLEVTVAGAAGSLVGLGLYADDGYGRPGNRLLDAGTVDGTTTGVKTLTTSTVVGPGVVWLASVSLGSPATAPTVRMTAGPVMPIGSTTTLASSAALAGYRWQNRTALDAVASIDVTVATSTAARPIYQT